MSTKTCNWNGARLL